MFVYILPGKAVLEVTCVGFDVKPYSLTHSLQFWSIQLCVCTYVTLSGDDSFLEAGFISKLCFPPKTVVKLISADRC